ncbi:MAG: phosphatidylglycerol lysyltransferase [Treponema sp.]|nr:phosphatidylglycerol lysyltransferase [Treponema sp.]
MVCKEEINTVLDKMILSASGWRGVFSLHGGEESSSEHISAACSIICGAAALAFADYLRNGLNVKSPIVLLGTDTRPTGKAIADAMIPVLLSEDCKVYYAGVTAAPEIMAWARCKKNPCPSGFIYISASHNPIGHNGFKFGLTDGGVLPADEANKLIAGFRALIQNDNCLANIEAIVSRTGDKSSADVYTKIDNAKAEARKAYYDFCIDVIYGTQKDATAAAMKKGLDEKPLGIVCDFNGSARTVSIDKDFLLAHGFKFEYINDKPGQIAHRIVPEGESLEPCCKLLEDAHARDASFVLGYVPDCDGDRGNLVIWDDSADRARALEAQEVFALACTAELSHLLWTGELSYDDDGRTLKKAAIAVNDPTSMRIDRIAEYLGVSVFRAEVGEANVVSLARKLREEGYLVRILGEGSAGGNITHPSAVRDPINTVLAIAKMLLIRSSGAKPGLFEIWRRCAGKEKNPLSAKLKNTENEKSGFTIAGIIESLPAFSSTPAYNNDAIMHIITQDHAILKERYQDVFLREWEERKNDLETRFGIHSWEAIAYNGTAERRGLKRFGESGRGGLKVLFFDSKKREIAYIWMRGSATEPVFRIMADVEGAETWAQKDLLEWQRSMIIKADRS